MKNSGDAAKLRLIESKTKVAELAQADRLDSGIFSDGTGSASKEITGLQATMSATSTYGGIAVAEMADWVAQVKTNSGTNRALTLSLMQAAFGAASGS